MRNKWLWISILLLAIVILIAACAQTTPAPTETEPAVDQEETITEQTEVNETTAEEQEPAEDEIEALIIERCSECHSADRVFQADYDADGWSDEVDDMIRKGAEVSEEEKALMIEWLISR
jgi:uncharacterized membrane protein